MRNKVFILFCLFTKVLSSSLTCSLDTVRMVIHWYCQTPKPVQNWELTLLSRGYSNNNNNKKNNNKKNKNKNPHQILSEGAVLGF